MHRTQGEDYVEIDGKRMYQAANPATATKATRLPADDMNAIQEEIAGAIESAGITLRATASADKAAGYTQLTAAIRALRDETGGTWKTFPLSAAALDVDGWTQNAIVLPSVWFDSIAYSSVTIKNAIMIVIPKWSAAGDTVTSCTFAQTEGATCPILRGNILLLQFGADGKISSYFSIPASSVDAIAQLKSLSVTNAVNAANVTATNAVNAENVTATSGVNANAVNATNVTATNAVNANAVNATNIVTATNVTATNAVNAENVTATSGVSAAVVDAGTANVTNANATNVTITSNFTTTSIMSYTADVDLTTYVVDHSMSYGQHLFIINTGTADITVTGKVMSGGGYTEKIWTLPIGTMCDFVAVPVSGYPNAIAKLG